MRFEAGIRTLDYPSGLLERTGCREIGRATNWLRTQVTPLDPKPPTVTAIACSRSPSAPPEPASGFSETLTAPVSSALGRAEFLIRKAGAPPKLPYHYF